MTVIGGLRARLVIASTYETVRSNLAALGWFDAGRPHLPINMIPRPVDRDEEIPFNTLALAPANVGGTAMEMGSSLEEDRIVFYADLYAEDDAVGVHLSQDVRDILRGLFPGTKSRIDVTDTTLTPPAFGFGCDVENVIWDKAESSARPWQRYWYVVRFDVVDDHEDS